MTSKAEKDLVYKLVNKKFSADFSVSKSNNSPNGHHFILTKDDNVTHLKVVNGASFEEEGIDEIKLLEAVNHPNIISLSNHGNLTDDFLFLEFAHIDGETLDKIRPVAGWGGLELERLAKDIGSAVQELNDANVVHRDIKPKNIIRDNLTGKYILLDLGIGYFTDQADRDNSKARGSRNYSSPEQFKSILSDTDDISHASDLFSLGVILYELATDEHPFNTFNKKKFSTMGEAICKMSPQPITILRPDLDSDIRMIIMRLLQKNPSNRYCNPSLFVQGLNKITMDKVQDLQFYIADPVSLDFIEDYMSNNPIDAHPDGVLLNISCSDDRIKRLKDKGLQVVLDPQSYKLPYPKSSQASMRKKLQLGDQILTMAKINDDRFLRKLTQKIVSRQEEASAIILPHFATVTLEDESININRKVEDIYFKYIRGVEETRKIYAGIMISWALITSDASLTKLLDRLMKKSKVDGYYVVFENSDDSPYVIDDYDYLNGVDRVLTLLKSKGRVIVGKADIAYLPLLQDGIIVTSPNKSERRYSFKDKLVSPKIQKGSTGEENWALRYYNEPLFNFIEDKSLLESLATLGFEDRLDCNCKYCIKAKPFDPLTEKSHNDSRLHFYLKISQLRNRLHDKRESEVNVFYAKMLVDAAKIAESIELKTSGSERFSRHERLIEIIKSRD